MRMRTIGRRQLVMGSAATPLAVLLAACGGQEATPASKTLAPATLRFTAGNGAADVRLFEPILPAYREERPEIKVEMEVVTGGWEKITALLVADSASDVTRINDDSAYHWSASGKLLQLDPFIAKSLKKDAYFPLTWQALAVEGKLFSLPPHVNVSMLIYNKSLFARAGITAPTEWAKAWDWPTYIANLRKLTNRDAGPGQETYGLWMREEDVIPLAWGNGARQYNATETRCTFNTREAVEILQEMQDLTHVQRVIAPPTENARQLFAAGRLGMASGNLAFGPQLPPDAPWDLMPYPKSKKGAFQEGALRVYAIPKATKQTDAAWDLFRWMMELKAQVHLGQGGLGVPTLKAAAEPTYKDGPFKDKNWKMIPEGINHDVPLALNPVAEEFKNQFAKGPVRNYLANEMTAQELLRVGSQAIDNKIAELNWRKKA